MDITAIMATASGIGLIGTGAIGATLIMVFMALIGELAGAFLTMDMDMDMGTQVIMDMVTDIVMVTDIPIITMVPIILMYPRTEADAIPITTEANQVEDRMKQPPVVRTTVLKRPAG